MPGRLDATPTFKAPNTDAESKVLSCSFETRGGEQAGPLLYLSELWFDGLPTIYLNGNTVGYHRDASSQRVLLDWSGETGRFDIEVR